MRVLLSFLVLFSLSVPSFGDEVRTVDGKRLGGILEWHRKDVRLRLPWGGVHRIRFRDVAAIRQVGRLEGEDLKKARSHFAKEKERLEGAERPDADDWVELGETMQGLRLDAEAREAFERAIELEPDNDDAHHALGQVKEDGSWQPAAPIIEARLDDVGSKNLRKRHRIARWAEKRDLVDLQERVLQTILRVDAFDKRAIRKILPLTAQYVQKSQLRPPLVGRWKALADPTHHHKQKKFALWAIDFVRVNEEGRTYTGSGRKLSDYLTWNEPVYATGDGKVVVVKDGFRDNPVGRIASWQKANLIALYHDSGEYSMYVHLKKGSITVKEGDTVKKGQLIARVGNSGASTRPHLHYALNDQNAISYPFLWEDYTWLYDDREIKVERGAPREDQLLVFPPIEGK